MVAPGARRVVRHVPPLAVVAAVAVSAAGLALLRRQPLSWDEAVTVAVATRPARAAIATVQHSDAVLGLYYLLMHAWSALLRGVGLRPTEIWWRLPSAAASVATCVVVAVCARRLAGPRAGVLAGCLLAAMPLFAFYAVDARPYALAALAAVAAWAVWTRTGPAVPSWSTSLLTAALLVTAGWLQLFTVLVWPAFVLVRGRAGRPRALVTVAAAAVGVAPLLRIALTQTAEIAWVPPASAATTVGVALHVGGGVAVVAALLLLAALATRAHVLRPTPRSVAVLWWCAAPLTLLAAADVVRPVLVARYALVSVPLVAVGVAVVVTRAGRQGPARAVRWVGLAAAVACAVTSVLQGSRPWKYEDYRGAARFAAATVPARTAVLFAPASARLGFERYPGSARLQDVALPRGVGADPLAIAETDPRQVADVLARRCEVVVVGDPVGTGTTHLPAADRAKLRTVAGWHLVRRGDFGAVTVSEFTDPACGADHTRTHDHRGAADRSRRSGPA